MTDLRQRVPAQALISEILRRRDLGEVHVSSQTGHVRLTPEARPWYTGVIGERRVADRLARLGEGWTVLHSVPVGRGTSDIDHVVIGQAGVFTLNTKHSPGKKVWVRGKGLLVDGHRTAYIRNAAGEARRASDLLSAASGLTVPVTGVIVFVGVAGIQFRSAPDGEGVDLLVVADHNLPAKLQTRPVFSEEQVARIVSAAVRPETWHKRPLPAVDGQAMAREFDALHAGFADNGTNSRALIALVAVGAAVVSSAVLFGAGLLLLGALSR
jgi:hypothetical protein